MRFFPFLMVCCLASTTQGGLFKMNGKKGQGDEGEDVCADAATLESVNQQLEEAIAVRDRLVEEKKSMEALLQSENKNRADQNKEWEHKVEALEAASAAQLSQLVEQKNTNEKFQEEQRANQKKISELIASTSILEGEAKAHQAMLEKIENKYEGKLTESEETKTRYLEATLKEEVDKAVLETNEEWKAKLDAAVADKEAAAKSIEDRLNKEIDTLRSEKDQFATDFDDKAGEIEEKWQNSFQSLKEEHAKSIKAAEAAAKKALDDLKVKTEADTREAMDTMRLSYDKQRDVMQAEIDKLTKYEAMYQEALKDAEYWETRFTNRNYLNVTHLATDAADTVTRASNAAVVKVAEAKKLANDHYVVASDHVVKQRAVIEEAAAPHVNYAAELYNSYMKEHVDKAIADITPHYEEHVTPVIAQGRTEFNRGLAALNDARHEFFMAIVEQFSKACPVIQDILKSAPEMQDRVESYCSTPEQSVTEIMLTFLVILALTFYKFLLRVVWGTIRIAIRFIFRVIWFFCPLRFFFRSKSATKKKVTKNGARGNGQKLHGVAQ